MVRERRSDGDAPMSERNRWDVLVVGAGPAGCHAARRLAAEGRRVLLLDENEGGRDEVVCTGIVGREAWEAMELPGSAVRDVVARARFVSPGGIDVRHDPPGPLARVVDRTVFDARLAARAAEAGARLARGQAVRGVEVGPEGVTLEARTGEGTARHRGRALVVATGHQRWLHEAAGLGTPDEYVHGVHLDVPFRDLDEAELYFGREVAPGFFAWAVPYGDMARLGVLARQGARRWLARFVRRPGIRDRMDGAVLEEQGLRRAVASRGIVQGKVEPSHADRVVAVGEAAGQVKTTTAGGIYYGMIGAELASEVLDEGLSAGRLDAAFLSDYERRWHERLGPEIRAGRELQRVGAEMTDEEIDRLFGALQEGLGRAVREMVRFDWHRPALRALLGRRAVWRRVVGRAVPSLLSA